MANSLICYFLLVIAVSAVVLVL